MAPVEDELPHTESWPFAPWPDVLCGAFEMEFRLVYDGKLPAQSQDNTRVKEKHHIRRVFSHQLAELWAVHPRLMRDVAVAKMGLRKGAVSVGPGIQISRPIVEYNRCGRTFIPLISNDHGVGCGLDILFLRRDQPGSLIRSGGDIDNRIKVLFDALRMPEHDGEVHGPADQDPTPFHCLLQDDRLITEVNVTTDRLLTPRADGEHINDVRLIIHVKTIAIDTSNLSSLMY